MIRVAAKVSLLTVLLVGLPLLGIVLTGQPLNRYLEFPPQTRHVLHPPFSWTVFITLALLITGSVSPFVLVTTRPRVGRDRYFQHHGKALASQVFPWWGWCGAALTATSWLLAWNRFAWFEPLQPFTFTPLWLGYILVVNAWVLSRTGRCMMLNRSRYFLSLFPLSSAFWWFFEYLNRFVNNWYYIGAQPVTPLEYVVHATISFSTVLPAVLGTVDLLASYPGIGAGLDRLPPLLNTDPKTVGWGVLVVACGGLTGIGVWPSYVFPLVWVAPLLVITSLQMIAGEETIFSSTARGDWKSLWLAALAALICGVFWEMWNYKSLSHWEYAIPFVHGYKVFEMPILGYAGYLPFGLECVAVAQFFFPKNFRDSLNVMQTKGA